MVSSRKLQLLLRPPNLIIRSKGIWMCCVLETICDVTRLFSFRLSSLYSISSSLFLWMKTDLFVVLKAKWNIVEWKRKRIQNRKCHDSSLFLAGRHKPLHSHKHSYLKAHIDTHSNDRHKPELLVSAGHGASSSNQRWMSNSHCHLFARQLLLSPLPSSSQCLDKSTTIIACWMWHGLKLWAHPCSFAQYSDVCKISVCLNT